MRVCETIRPGEGGSKRFLERYGDRLVCVRYRHDPVANRRLTTVGLIVDEGEYEPPPHAIMGVEVRLDEPVLRARVRAAGGTWDATQRLWELPYGTVALDLQDRIRPRQVSTSRHRQTRLSRSGQNGLHLDNAAPRRRCT